MHYCDTALIIRVAPKLDSIELNAELLPEFQSCESGELDTIDLIADLHPKSPGSLTLLISLLTYFQRVLGA